MNFWIRHGPEQTQSLNLLICNTTLLWLPPFHPHHLHTQLDPFASMMKNNFILLPLPMIPLIASAA